MSEISPSLRRNCQNNKSFRAIAAFCLAIELKQNHVHVGPVMTGEKDVD